MEGRGKALFGGEHIGPAFEELRRETGRHGTGLIREGVARREPARRVVAGDDLYGTDRLRPGRLREVNRVLRSGGARALICARSKSLA